MARLFTAALTLGISAIEFCLTLRASCRSVCHKHKAVIIIMSLPRYISF